MFNLIIHPLILLCILNNVRVVRSQNLAFKFTVKGIPYSGAGSYWRDEDNYWCIITQLQNVGNVLVKDNEGALSQMMTSYTKKDIEARNLGGVEIAFIADSNNTIDIKKTTSTIWVEVVVQKLKPHDKKTLKFTFETFCNFKIKVKEYLFYGSALVLPIPDESHFDVQEIHEIKGNTMDVEDMLTKLSNNEPVKAFIYFTGKNKVACNLQSCKWRAVYFKKAFKEPFAVDYQAIEQENVQIKIKTENETWELSAKFDWIHGDKKISTVEAPPGRNGRVFLNKTAPENTQVLEKLRKYPDASLSIYLANSWWQLEKIIAQTGHYESDFIAKIVPSATTNVKQS